MLVTQTQADELLGAMIGLSGLDPELADTCGPLIRSERYDEAVGRAFVVLEERLRELLRVSSGTGRHLVQTLFAKDGQYGARLQLPPSELDGLYRIFDGSFAAFRNRAAHTMAGYSLDEARGIVHLVSLLLLVLEQMKKPPPPAIPVAIAETLGPAATERLQRFLGRLEAMGIGTGRGKGLLPYRAMLRYKSESWDAPRAHSVTIFYLTMDREGRPALAFNTPYLAKVPGLDRKDVERALLESECVRVGTKLRPIWLYLDEHNDEATLDRINGLVLKLLVEHQA